MAKLKYQYFTPEYNIKREQKAYLMAKEMEPIVEAYPKGVILSVRYQKDIYIINMDDDATVEECWDFVSYMEDALGQKTETNRPTFCDSFNFWYNIPHNGYSVHIDNCKEHCVLTYEERVIPEHTETVTIPVCADTMKVLA